MLENNKSQQLKDIPCKNLCFLDICCIIYYVLLTVLRWKCGLRQGLSRA